MDIPWKRYIYGLWRSSTVLKRFKIMYIATCCGQWTMSYRKDANDDGFVRMDSVSEHCHTSSNRTSCHLQRDTSDTSVWNKVAYTPEDIHNIDDYTIGCLQEAYFMIQNSCSICHLHVRFAEIYRISRWMFVGLKIRCIQDDYFWT
jgi:hypothetical protein